MDSGNEEMTKVDFLNGDNFLINISNIKSVTLSKNTPFIYYSYLENNVKVERSLDVSY